MKSAVPTTTGISRVAAEYPEPDSTVGAKGSLLGGLVGALVVFGIALLLLLGPFRVGKAFVNTSYDWSFDLTPAPDMSGSEVVMVLMDEDSHKALNQPFNWPWDRTLHGELLGRLKDAEAKAVVFDVIFSDAAFNTNADPNPAVDQYFEKAIRQNGRVVLAGDYVYSQAGGSASAVGQLAKTPPLQRFRDAAAGWGWAMVQPDDDFTVRRHWHGTADVEELGMVWSAAGVIGLPLARDPKERLTQRWIRYYGDRAAIPSVSYHQALATEGVANGFFRNKVVFVGGGPMTRAAGERRDEMRCPLSRWGTRTQFMPGIEVHATQMLNLIRHDWLTTLPVKAQVAVLLVTALLFGFGLCQFKPVLSAGIAFGGAIVCAAIALLVFAKMGVWFPWLIVVAVQIPLALVWAMACRSIEWYVAKVRLEHQRRQADRRIREQAQRLDIAPCAIIVLDLDWRVCDWNKGAERLYGWPAAELLKQHVPETVFSVNPDRLKQARQTVLDAGQWSGELRQRSRNGTELEVQSTWMLAVDDEGSPKEVIVINTDITEQKRLEVQFLRAQRMESIGTLAGGIAHDLNNTLSPIMMGIDLLCLKPCDADMRAMLKTMSSSAKRGSDLVKQVLTFARGHQGERIVLQLGQLVGDIQKIASETFPKSITVQARVDDELWPILGDATQVHQILLNLCVNARDAMGKGGALKLEAWNIKLDESDAKRILGAKPIEYVLISVSDTGTGIAPEILDRIFEPFFTTKEPGKGTGLGLSTLLSIVKGHDGVVDVQSEVGKGTTFSIYLPAVPEAVAAADVQGGRNSVAGDNQSILLVDDEAAILEMTEAILMSCGYRVLTASNGQAAVELCSRRKEPVDLVIVDLMMPGMDGHATIRALKKIRPELPVILASGCHPGGGDVAKSGGGEIAFLSKPFTLEQLTSAVQKALAVAKAAPASQVVPAIATMPAIPAIPAVPIVPTIPALSAVPAVPVVSTGSAAPPAPVPPAAPALKLRLQKKKELVTA